MLKRVVLLLINSQVVEGKRGYHLGCLLLPVLGNEGLGWDPLCKNVSILVVTAIGRCAAQSLPKSLGGGTTGKLACAKVASLNEPHDDLRGLSTLMGFKHFINWWFHTLNLVSRS